MNPETGEIESLEILFFSTRVLRGDVLELPVYADLRRVGSVPPANGRPTRPVDR